MLMLLGQIKALIGCFLSFVSEMVVKYKLHWPLACLITGFLCYQWGYHNAVKYAEAKQAEQVITQQNANNEALVKTNETTKELSQALVAISDEREKGIYEITTKSNELIDTYVAPSYGMRYEAPTQTGNPYPGVRSSKETAVDVNANGWEFSAKDRRTLIEEAARADQQAKELQSCKDIVDSIYKNHDKYKTDMKEFEKKINLDDIF